MRPVTSNGYRAGQGGLTGMRGPGKPPAGSRAVSQATTNPGCSPGAPGAGARLGGIEGPVRRYRWPPPERRSEIRHGTQRGNGVGMQTECRPHSETERRLTGTTRWLEHAALCRLSGFVERSRVLAVTTADVGHPRAQSTRSTAARSYLPRLRAVRRRGKVSSPSPHISGHSSSVISRSIPADVAVPNGGARRPLRS